LRRL
jgi:hypothetical protein